MDPKMTRTLVGRLNRRLAARRAGDGALLVKLESERADLARQAANLVRYLALGSITVTDELTRLEKLIAELDHEMAGVRGREAAKAEEADAEWVSAEIQRLYELLSSDPVAAKATVARHLEDGELRIAPLEGTSGARVAMISGAVNEHGLLAGGHVGIDHCGGRIRMDRQPPLRSPWNPSGSRWICRAWGDGAGSATFGTRTGRFRSISGVPHGGFGGRRAAHPNDPICGWFRGWPGRHGRSPLGCRDLQSRAVLRASRHELRPATSPDARIAAAVPSPGGFRAGELSVANVIPPRSGCRVHSNRCVWLRHCSSPSERFHQATSWFTASTRTPSGASAT